MSRDPAYLLDILHSARQAHEYVSGLTKDDFLQDIMRQDAVLRRLEIVGEATKRLSIIFREAYPEILWQKMAGMRDVLIHQYDRVEFDLVWDTATQFIPPLIEQLEILSKSLGIDHDPNEV